MAEPVRRLAGLDGLRGLAACWVMLYHYTAWYGHEGGGHPDPGPFWVVARGHFGVELFFIISGFVIPLTLTRTASWRDFALSRLARLYPAFLACVLLTALATLALAPRMMSADSLLASLTMAPELFGTRGIDGSYWSLLYEIVFYTLAAAAWFGLGCRTPELPCALWMAVAMTVRLGWPDAGVTLLTQLTAAWFAHLFVIGVMLFRIHAGQATRLTWLLLAIALEMTLLGPHWSFQSVTATGFAAMILGFTLLVWFATTPAGAILAFGPLRALGRMSYPLYLVHQATGFLVIAALEQAGLGPDAAVAITIALAVAVAWAISTAIEWPAQRWLRARWFPRPAGSRVALASAAG